MITKRHSFAITKCKIIKINIRLLICKERILKLWKIVNKKIFIKTNITMN